jgi:chorismate mutase/prephenate dehydratase
MSEQELKALRVRIDSLDEVLELISERARCAQEVARVKMASLAEGECRCSIVLSAKLRCSSA